MARVIGRGRYATETYPEGPGGGGAAAGIVPLSRQRFVDGDTATTGRTGSVAEPFKTIAEFMAARGNASVADATANFVGWLMPTLAGYVENVAFPPYASTELRADSLSLAAGTIISGNVTWGNILGAKAASPVAAVAMHNVSVTGTVTITDDPGAPTSIFSFSADEIGDDSASIVGGFVSSATTKLQTALFTNALIDDINAGTAANSAFVQLFYSTISGTISAQGLSCVGSRIDVSAITVNSNGLCSFQDTNFASGSNPVLTAIASANFDGASWRSFLEAGGTRAPAGDAGTPVLVVGGFSAGAVEGAVTAGGSGTFDVSLNGAGATAGLQGSNSGNSYAFTGMGGDVTVNLQIGGAKVGDTIMITKPGLDAHTITVHNSGGTPADIGIIPSGGRGFLLARFDGTDWKFVSGGSLAA